MLKISFKKLSKAENFFIKNIKRRHIRSDQINESSLQSDKKRFKLWAFNDKKIMAKYGQRIVKKFYHDQFCIFR